MNSMFNSKYYQVDSQEEAIVKPYSRIFPRSWFYFWSVHQNYLYLMTIKTYQSYRFMESYQSNPSFSHNFPDDFLVILNQMMTTNTKTFSHDFLDDFLNWRHLSTDTNYFGNNFLDDFLVKTCIDKDLYLNRLSWQRDTHCFI